MIVGKTFAYNLHVSFGVSVVELFFLSPYTCGRRISYGSRLRTSGHELSSEPMDSLCREGLVSASSPIGYK